jgi:hypothetical protein
MRIEAQHTWMPGGQLHVGATLGRWVTTAGRHRTCGIHGTRLWAGMDHGHGDDGRHDSVGAGQQIGGGETGVGWSDCGGSTGQPCDLVGHTLAKGAGPVGQLGRRYCSGPGPVPRSQYPFPILQLLQI